MFVDWQSRARALRGCASHPQCSGRCHRTQRHADLGCCLQVSSKLQAAEDRLRKMQAVISTDAEAEKSLSGQLERLHRWLSGLVNAAPDGVGWRLQSKRHACGAESQ